MRGHFRLSGACAALAMAATGLASAPAQAEQVGYFTAVCQVAGAPAQMQIRYTIYGDIVAWQGPHGRHTGTTDMGQNIVYWEGRLVSSVGGFRIEGRNNLIEAFPDGGHYSDKVDLQVVQTGPDSFAMYSFPDASQGMFPCQITG